MLLSITIDINYRYLPRPTKGCFLKAFKYLKTTRLNTPSGGCWYRSKPFSYAFWRCSLRLLCYFSSLPKRRPFDRRSTNTISVFRLPGPLGSKSLHEKSPSTSEAGLMRKGGALGMVFGVRRLFFYDKNK